MGGIFYAKNCRVIGFVACDGNFREVKNEKIVGEIHELVVIPEYRGQGIGALLLQRALEYLKERGIEEVLVWVYRGNERAKRFYQKHNFEFKEQKGDWVRMGKLVSP